MPGYLAKPYWPTLTSEAASLATLRGYWPLHETNGPAVDLIRGVSLPQVGSGTRTPSTTGYGANSTGSNSGYGAVAPPHLRLALPVTIAARLRFTGTPDSFSLLWGLSHNNADTNPYLAYALEVDGSGNFSLSGNSGGSFFRESSSTSTASLSGAPFSLVGVITATTRTLYLNSASILSVSGSYSNPTFDVTSTAGIGYYPAGARSSKAVTECCLIDNTAWSLDRVIAFSADPFAWARGEDEEYAAAALAASLFRRSLTSRTGSRSAA